MRRLLISVAALALASGTALAQPGHGHGHEHGARPDAGRADTGHQFREPRPMQMAQGGGPTSFTNQVTGQAPTEGRGNWQGRGAQQPAPQQQAVAPPQQLAPDRGNRQGHGDRGNWQGRATPQQQASAPDNQNRGNWQDRNGYRGNWQGRNGYADANRGYDNRGSWQNRQGYDNGRGWNGDRYASRNSRFSGFRDFHRDWRATQRFRAGGYHRPYGWYAHHWTFGEFLPQPFWARDYWLMDYMDYGLPPPPYGAIWVRVDQDALLIDRDSGEIITVVYNVFY
jgi:Ni/Co efflux regulator RcnB